MIIRIPSQELPRIIWLGTLGDRTVKLLSNSELSFRIAESDEASELALLYISDHKKLEELEIEELGDRLILWWDQEGRPELKGHDEANRLNISKILKQIEDGYAASGYYVLLAAIGEMYSCNFSKAPNAWTDLFNAIHAIASNELLHEAIVNQEEAAIALYEERKYSHVY